MNRIADYVADLKLNTRGANRKLGKFDRDAKESGRQIAGRFGIIGTTLSKNLALGGIIGTGAGLIAIAKNATRLETALIGVQKTTGLIDKESQKLKKSLLDLGTELPVSTLALFDIAKVAGQLGIKGVENITKFTETFAKLEIASDRTISGEFGAQAFARFLINSGAGISAANQLGSAITFLGNNAALTEGQLLSTSLEIGKISKSFNIDPTAVLGIASTLTELGVAPDVAATSIQKFFKSVETAIQDGKGLEELVELTGLTAESIGKLREQNPEQILVQFGRGLAKAKEEGRGLTKELKELGLSDIRVDKVLKAITSSSVLLAQRIKEAAAAAEEGIGLSALDEEAAVAADTLESSIKELSNSFVLLGDSLAGAGLTDFLKSITDTAGDGVVGLSKLIDKFGSLSQVQKVLITSGFSILPGSILAQDLSAAQAKDSINKINDQQSQARDAVQRLIQKFPSVLDNQETFEKASRLGVLSKEQIQQRNASALDRQSSANGSSGNNVEIKNDIKVTSPNPIQAGNEISRIVSADVALGVGS